MLPYPPSIKRDVAERSLLRVLGGVLASSGILLALLGIIFYQRTVDLILAIIVGTFAVRVLLLWLGHKSQHQLPLPEWSSRERYTIQASSYSQPRPVSQLAAQRSMQHGVPVPPVSDAPSPPKLPRSIRPQRSAEAATFPVQPISASPPPQPSSLWSPPLSAPASGSSRQEIWQYDDGKI